METPRECPACRAKALSRMPLRFQIAERCEACGVVFPRPQDRAAVVEELRAYGLATRSTERRKAA